MKVFVRKNNVAKFGYELVVDGNVIAITSKTTDGYFRVPALESTHNIKMLKISTIESNLDENGEFEVLPREQRTPRTITTGPKTTISKSDREYLNDDDKVLYDQLMAKIEKAKAIAKAKAIYEAAQREYQELLKAGE